jgi:hypothetical protein
MSLDVYLEGSSQEVECCCPICFNDHKRVDTDELYSANITHNLNRMAGEAGIYEILWRPDEVGIERAGQIVETLRKGIDLMKSDPPRFEQHNPSNGWGSYKDFIPWLEKYLSACEENPDAIVKVSR